MDHDVDIYACLADQESLWITHIKEKRDAHVESPEAEMKVVLRLTIDCGWYPRQHPRLCRKLEKSTPHVCLTNCLQASYSSHPW